MGATLTKEEMKDVVKLAAQEGLQEYDTKHKKEEHDPIWSDLRELRRKVDGTNRLVWMGLGVFVSIGTIVGIVWIIIQVVRLFRGMP